MKKHEFCLLSLYIIGDKGSLKITWCFKITTKNLLTLKAAQTPEFCHLRFFFFHLSKVLPKDTFQLLAIGTPYTAKLCLGVILSRETQREEWQGLGERHLFMAGELSLPSSTTNGNTHIGDSNFYCSVHICQWLQRHTPNVNFGVTQKF